VGDAMISHKYRFNWNSPIALSPLNPKVVYFGGNVLFKSTDYGMSWQVIAWMSRDGRLFRGLPVPYRERVLIF